MSLYDSQVGVLYQITDQKPDKKYSILPTVLSLVGDVKDKTVLDLGGGTGFFSHHIAKLGARMVIGIDNSILKIGLASGREKHPNVIHALGDVFYNDLPDAGVILGAFVLNYAEHVVELEGLFRRVYNALPSGGRFVGLIDLPSGKDLTFFGAMKQLAEEKDGAKMFIHLYDDDGVKTCTLEANYFTKGTVENLAKKVGFTSFEWHNPIVSDEGRAKYQEMNWEEYIRDPELGYFVAEK
jgi:toxoflavin synthase